MLVNSRNYSLLSPHNSSTNLYSTSLYCFNTPPNSFLFITLYITKFFTVLPLSFFILCCGFKQWRRRRSTSSAATTSHSDCFTYHMVIIELIGVFNCLSICWGIYLKDLRVLIGNLFLTSFLWHGQTFFHLLTCVERYLAVVHPVFYLSLRNKRGIRARNVILGSVWLLCCVTMVFVLQMFLVILDFCIIVLILATVSFSSFSVLRVLNRPGPGEQSGDRERGDQSKRRAFYTIVAILGVLIVRFAWGLILAVLVILEESGQCVMMICGFLFDLPVSLVLPLLFLYRKGKIVCRKNSMK